MSRAHGNVKRVRRKRKALKKLKARREHNVSRACRKRRVTSVECEVR